jgi:hypothetical protein
MALCLYEENGRFRVYDEETKRSFSSAEKIEDLLKVLDRNRALRLYIGMDAFSMRKIVLPDLDRDKMLEVLPFEMEGLFLSPSSDLVFDFCSLRPAENGMECLVFALKKETAEQYIAPFVKAGLNIVSLSPLWDDKLSESFIDEGVFYKTALNLAPAGLTGSKNKKKAMDVYRTAFIYAIAVLLIFISGLSVRYYLILKKETRMNKEVAEGYASLFPGQKMPSDLYYGIQSKLVELKQNYRVFKGMEVLGILKSISESSREGVRVKEINMDGNKAIVKGEGSDYAVVEQFRNNLKKSFNNLQLLETKSLPDNKVVFVVEVTIHE